MEPEEPTRPTPDKTTPSRTISYTEPPSKPTRPLSINSLDPTPAKTNNNKTDPSLKSNSLLTRTNSTTDRNARNLKTTNNVAPTKVTLRRNLSLTSSKSKIANSPSTESFKMLQADGKPTVKRSSSVSAGAAKGRTTTMGFMKPTTSSTTKSTTPSTRKSFVLRGRN